MLFLSFRKYFTSVAGKDNNNILDLVINSYIIFQFKFIFQRYRKMELKYGH